MLPPPGGRPTRHGVPTTQTDVVSMVKAREHHRKNLCVLHVTDTHFCAFVYLWLLVVFSWGRLVPDGTQKYFVHRVHPATLVYSSVPGLHIWPWIATERGRARVKLSHVSAPNL